MSAVSEPRPGAADRSEPVARLGDPETWVDEHGDALLRYALLRVEDLATAEDLVQETLLAAWRGRDRYSAECSPRTWMIAILKRRVADHFRQHGRRKANDGADAALAQEAAPQPSAVENAEFWSVFSDCTGDLPDHLARAFHLRTFAEASPESICGAEGITPKNLSVRLHRARQLLRRCLEVKWFSDGDRGVLR